MTNEETQRMSDIVLDPDMAAIAAAFQAAIPPGPRDLAQMRRRVAENPLPTPCVPVARIEDLTIPGPAGDIPARLYAPAEGAPLMLFFHGGGWVICSIDTHDAVCRALAEATGAAILSIDYRLAPEHKFPAAFEDAAAALVWAAAHAAELGCDPSRIAVSGDSAGGNLAAAAALAAPSLGVRLTHQLLIYPALDPMQRGASHARYQTGPMLDAPGMAWYWAQYLNGPSDQQDPRAAPLLAANYGIFPPTTLVLAEHDPLYDDGTAFAEGLRAAGVPTKILRYEGVTHAFFSMYGLVAKAATAYADVGAALRTALA
jgi:acetyl esterase/lipase